jgi:hypothetical protein
MNEEENKIVRLYPDIGYRLLNFLDGIDSCNFIEVVNDTDQFSSIATATDYHFRNFVQQIFSRYKSVGIPQEILFKYSEFLEDIDDKIASIRGSNLSFIRPIQHLFLYPCFTIEGFRKLCRVYRTPLFECYSRLLSFNIDLYCADFGLIDYTLYMPSIAVERELNEHERKLFKSEIFKIENEKHIFATYLIVIEWTDRSGS